MPGLCLSNDYIARDEGLHVEFAVHLYNRYIVNKLTQEEVDELIYEAVDIEKAFIEETIPEPLLGMNKELMSEYAEFVANRLMTQFGYTTKFDIKKCPFPFMDKICLPTQSSFFDGRVSEYQFNDTVEKVKTKLKFDVDF